MRVNRGTRAGLCQRPARLITGTADGAWPGCWAESGLAAGGGSPAPHPQRIHPHRTRRAACTPPEVQQMDGDCLSYQRKRKKKKTKTHEGRGARGLPLFPTSYLVLPTALPQAPLDSAEQKSQGYTPFSYSWSCQSMASFSSGMNEETWWLCRKWVFGVILLDTDRHLTGWHNPTWFLKVPSSIVFRANSVSYTNKAFLSLYMLELINMSRLKGVADTVKSPALQSTRCLWRAPPRSTLTSAAPW